MDSRVRYLPPSTWKRYELEEFIVSICYEFTNMKNASQTLDETARMALPMCSQCAHQRRPGAYPFNHRFRLFVLAMYEEEGFDICASVICWSIVLGFDVGISTNTPIDGLESVSPAMRPSSIDYTAASTDESKLSDSQSYLFRRRNSETTTSGTLLPGRSLQKY